ncbi:MAG: hypothetical protein H7X95_04515, partial [Deltaproteobacteria bacterium]|nr:hypothetical protein [Deltaproteobacteria bacterium]
MSPPPMRWSPILCCLNAAAVAAVVLPISCGTPAPRPPVNTANATNGAPRPLGLPPARPDEPHLAELRQMTFGGENAEAYWSFNGADLIFQARAVDAGCDRIFRMSALDIAPQPTRIPVSNGAGVTTCSFFLPGTRDVIFSSTHLAGPACPPRPDHRQGYVWALYPSYDIFR